MAFLAVQVASDRMQQFIHLARLKLDKIEIALAIQGAMTCYQAATENEECKKQRKTKKNDANITRSGLEMDRSLCL